MAHTLLHLFLALLIVCLVLNSDDAQADQIDGHWCYKDGRSLSIRGPQIITPGGSKMRGDYDRHGFAYVVPKGVVSDSWWKLVFGVAPDHDGCSIRRRGQSAS